MADYFWVKHSYVIPRDLYREDPQGAYWYQNGWNPLAIRSLITGAIVGLLFVFIPALDFLGAFSWAISALVAGVTFTRTMRSSGVAARRVELERVRAEQTKAAGEELIVPEVKLF